MVYATLKNSVLCSLMLCCAGALFAEKISLETPAGLRQWSKTVSGITLEEGFVKVSPTKEDLTKKGLLGLWKPVHIPKYAGKTVRFSAEIMLKDVVPLSGANYAGTKCIVTYGEDGKRFYPGIPEMKGTKDWKRYERVFRVPKSGYISINIGLQSASGTVGFRNLKIEEAEDINTDGNEL